MNNRKTRIVYYFLLIFILLTSNCKKEELGTPLVFTGQVKNISESGATFFGRIVNIDSPSNIDVGFVWSKNATPFIEDDYIMYSDSIRPDGVFSLDVGSTLLVGEYYVKAFARSENSVYYGQTVNFLSLGSNGVEIKGVYPSRGIWGDTITLHVDGLNQNQKQILVNLNNLKAEVVCVNNNEIQLIVPIGINNSPVSISILIPGNNVKLENAFEICKPVIDSIVPLSGSFLQPVRIYGKHIHPYKTRIYFDEEIINLREQTDSCFMLYMPYFTENDIKTILAANLLNEGDNTFEFQYNSPQIYSIDPPSVDYGDTVRIEGLFFSGKDTAIVIRYYSPPYYGSCDVINSSANEIEFIVKHVNNKTVNYYTRVANTYLSSLEFELSYNDPIVSSIHPLDVMVGDTVTISGEHFYPTASGNIIRLGNKIATRISGSKTMIEFRVPELDPGDYEIQLSVGFYNNNIGTLHVHD